MSLGVFPLPSVAAIGQNVCVNRVSPDLRSDIELAWKEGSMDKGMSRRRFIMGAGASGLIAGVAGRTADGAVALEEAKPISKPEMPSIAAEREGPLLRMQRELQHAMDRPLAARRWSMVIDLRKCVGCSACTIACKAENGLPPGVVYRPVLEEELGQYPNVSRRFTPRPCMQCDNPPCVPVCPVGATYKRPDGVVEINYEQCIGCRYCITACPYSARTFDSGDFYTRTTPKLQPYEELPSPEYGGQWVRAEGRSPVGNVRKCQFCLHRLEAGMLPACVTTCIGGATFFGDADDTESLVSELLSRGNAMRLKEEMGTKPKVCYLL